MDGAPGPAVGVAVVPDGTVAVVPVPGATVTVTPGDVDPVACDELEPVEVEAFAPGMTWENNPAIIRANSTMSTPSAITTIHKGERFTTGAGGRVPGTGLPLDDSSVDWPAWSGPGAGYCGEDCIPGAAGT